jgi:hypothetical protein
MNTSTRRFDNTNYRPYPGDNHLVVTFSMEEFKNELKTREAGRAIYEDREMVHIRIPGDKQLTIDAPANSYCTMGDGTKTTYSDRFPEDYDRWKQGQGAALTGTALKHAPFLSKAEVSNLAASNVFTIEQLAEMGGAPLRSLGQSGRKWQQQALAYLKAATGTRDVTAEAAERAALMDRIAQLEAAAGVAPVAKVEEPKVEQRDEDEYKAELKNEIERVTGRRPLGNPSVQRLESDLQEATKAASEV